MMKVLATLLILLPASAMARGAVPFDGTWERITFPFQTATRFTEQGEDMMIEGDGSVSIAWRQLDPVFWQADRASWTVDILQSVPATDLSLKGGDDRNLSLYFVFAGDDTAARAQRGASLARVLRQDDVRVLLYVFGGTAARGAQFDSPYMDGKGRVIIKAPAEAGTFSEDVDLAADFAQAFSGPRGNLIGVALSTDSDDTDTQVRAMVSDLTLR
ncbi:hypothetical protein FHS89_001194 [Rubricella aquisinus]|uniref:DUF3047 domain-containing protein n=1 Tax=Rubricella aquisinus TaxID=2028108 RepID=A0A840WXT3_9RHOB|nr:DUF3047 domain-containing protein [Rubricella aquisinus]MBB5515184.1 hypothetical protein [Rubricella aquisinus]